MTEEMEPSVTMSDYSSDSSDSSIYSSGTSSVGAMNSEASSYSEETDSDIDVSSIKPYQFEPSTERSIFPAKNLAKRTMKTMKD